MVFVRSDSLPILTHLRRGRTRTGYHGQGEGQGQGLKKKQNLNLNQTQTRTQTRSFNHRIGIGGDRTGQMHIMEIVTAGLLFLVALNLVANMTVTPTQSSQPLYQVQKLGTDVLRILDTTPVKTSGYSSFLDEALTTDNITTIRERIDESLPETISYNLTLVAIDDYFFPLDAGAGSTGNEVDHGVLVSIDKRSLVLITLGETGEQSATCHRIVYLHDGAVHEAGTDEQFQIAEGWYDVTLILWFEPRGE